MEIEKYGGKKHDGKMWLVVMIIDHLGGEKFFFKFFVQDWFSRGSRLLPNLKF